MLRSLRSFLFLAAGAFAAIGLHAARVGGIQPPEQAAIDRISSDSMRGNLSFLASDLLEGRDTPSRGLDIAAEFIASRFRAAGLEPIAPGGSYFQEAKFSVVKPNADTLSLTLNQDGEELQLDGADVTAEALSALSFDNAPVLKLPESGAIPEVEGRVVAGNAARWSDEALLANLQARKPALILLVSRRRRPALPRDYLEPLDIAQAPVLRVFNEDAAASLRRTGQLTVTIRMAAPGRRDLTLRNVGGILRGSDPALASQAVLLTAHYDHLGEKAAGLGDRIFNGANDNGSGVVSVLEIANALATLHPRPRRTIVFMTFFGEEEGLLGAYFYARHPAVPLKDTVADINLEQMGRTDENSGAEVGAFAFTGPSYSDLPEIMSSAAGAEGVKTWRKESADEFFDRSDNYAFALRGVVAHTVVVAFEYPDYHAVGDEWRKIDYDNMAKVDRGVAAGVLAIADASDRPRWTDSAQTARYRGGASK